MSLFLRSGNSPGELSRRSAVTPDPDLDGCTVQATGRGRPGGRGRAARSAPTAAAVVSPGLVAQRIFSAARIIVTPLSGTTRYSSGVCGRRRGRERSRASAQRGSAICRQRDALRWRKLATARRRWLDRGSVITTAGQVLQGYFRVEAFRRELTKPVVRPVQRLPGMAPSRVSGPFQVAQARMRPGVSATPIAAQHLHMVGLGHPIEPGLRNRVERFFRADFSSVRIHHSPAAAAIGARAFTLGDQIHFAPGQSDPASHSGLALLGHELAHVLQQRHRRVANPYGHGVAIVQDPALEAEADRLASQLAAIACRPAKHPAVQRPPIMRLGRARPTFVVQRMEEHRSMEFDDEIHEYDDYGSVVPKEPPEGWEAYEAAVNEERRRQYEAELREREIDALIEIDRQLSVEATGGYLQVAERYGPEHVAAVWYLAEHVRRNTPGADQLLTNFGQEMNAQRYAFIAGYLFQIAETKKLEQAGYKILQVEPSLRQWVGETRYGDVLIRDAQGQDVIVEIKNWTGYLKGAAKNASIAEKNKRECERKVMLKKLSDQLTRYVKTGRRILFIWKGQLPIDVTMLLQQLKSSSNGSFNFKCVY